MSRGKLNTKIIGISKKFMGRIITIDELRLLAYVDYILKNCGDIDITKINKDEERTLENFEKAEYITLDKRIEDGYRNQYMKISCKSKEFYNFMQEVLYESYTIKEGE